jgi:hypothetical protein
VVCPTAQWGFYFDRIRGPRGYQALDGFGEITPRIGERGR